MAFVQANNSLLSKSVRIAISHNRMPSIGDVSYNNTHPFFDCKRRFALIHNGTAFNHDYRKRLLEKGHRILGETDSELLTHKLEDYYEETGDMVEALKMLVENDLRGAVIVLERSRKMYAARRGYISAHYAAWKGEVYIASEAKAITNLIGCEGAVKPLEDGEIIMVDSGRIRRYRVKVPIELEKEEPRYYRLKTLYSLYGLNWNWDWDI